MPDQQYEKNVGNCTSKGNKPSDNSREVSRHPNKVPKFGHGHHYDHDQLDFFARYRDQRGLYRPSECTRGPSCWVDLGPPGYSTGAATGGGCIECGGRARGKPEADHA